MEPLPLHLNASCDTAHESDAQMERECGRDSCDRPVESPALRLSSPSAAAAQPRCSATGGVVAVLNVNSPVRLLELVDRDLCRQVGVESVSPNRSEADFESCRFREERHQRQLRGEVQATSGELVVAAVVEDEARSEPSHTARAFRTSADGVCIVRSAVLVAEVQTHAPVDARPGEVGRLNTSWSRNICMCTGAADAPTELRA